MGQSFQAYGTKLSGWLDECSGIISVLWVKAFRLTRRVFGYNLCPMGQSFPADSTSCSGIISVPFFPSFWKGTRGYILPQKGIWARVILTPPKTTTTVTTNKPQNRTKTTKDQKQNKRQPQINPKSPPPAHAHAYTHTNKKPNNNCPRAFWP